MNRAFLLSIVAVLVVPLDCRSGSNAPTSIEEPETTAAGNGGGAVPADPNLLGIEQGDKITDRLFLFDDGTEFLRTMDRIY
jgi:hypothetical protein